MAEPISFSILTPVYNTSPDHLRECIESVIHQDYPHWEMCIVDDASSSAETLDVLNHYVHYDSRIKVLHRESNGGISAASNDALEMATGEYVALLDHDDTLNMEALGTLNHVLAYEPHWDVVYSDEDKFERLGRWFQAFFKPDWSPDALLTQMYFGHLTAYRRSVVREVGGFRLGYEGAQDWDLALRVTELTQNVKHIARTLYHWRSHPASTAESGDAKPYAVEAGRRAVNDALARRGLDAWAEQIPELPLFVVRHRLPEPPPLVSVIIPTAAGYRDIRGERTRLIDVTLRTLATRNAYRNIEIIVMLSRGVDPGVADELRPLVGDLPIHFVGSDEPFDFSMAINRGVAHSSGSLLLLLNDDVEAVDDRWLQLMVETLQTPGVGVVGPRLLFADDTVQHAGVVHHGSMPFHLQRGQADGPGYFGEVCLTRNYLAVTGACLLTPRATFDAVGGLSALFPMNYNDIDYCLKVVRQRLRVVYLGQAKLYHYESSSRSPSVTTDEIHVWLRHWADVTSPDPYLPPAIDASIPG